MIEYIDKQRVIDIINKICPDLNIPEINDSWANKLIGIIREELVELVTGEPAADVREHVKGEWIESEEIKDIWYPMFRCSVCHWFCAGISNFCPNCGAYMMDKNDGSY